MKNPIEPPKIPPPREPLAIEYLLDDDQWRTVTIDDHAAFLESIKNEPEKDDL